VSQQYDIDLAQFPAFVLSATTHVLFRLATDDFVHDVTVAEDVALDGGQEVQLGVLEENVKGFPGGLTRELCIKLPEAVSLDHRECSLHALQDLLLLLLAAIGQVLWSQGLLLGVVRLALMNVLLIILGVHLTT